MFAERSDDPPRSRIILPGQEHEPSGRPTITGPGGEVPGAEPPAASRIVLPPGVAPPEEENLPEYPRLRPLTLMPVRDGERDLILVNDPLGVLPAPVALRMESLDLLQLLDGRTSLADLSAAVVRASKDIRAGAYVKQFIAELDRMLLLESPRFEEAYRTLREDYHRLEIRQAVFWGLSYPEAPEEVAKFVDGHFAAAEAMRDAAGEPRAAADAVPKALLAPHLDPRRAGPLMARAWLEVGAAAPEPLRIVVLGVGHTLWGDRVALTRKDFETPFGPVPCDTAFVDAIAARLGDAAWHGELAHRDEHSIEFQALYLRRRLGQRRVSIVPILIGGFHDLLDHDVPPREDLALDTLISAVRDAAATLGGTTLYVASVDLAHVGPRFGDPELDDRTLAELSTFDHQALERARRGDAEAWNEHIVANDDAYRICGWGATYTLLRMAEPGAGRLLGYEQSREENGSVVSVGTIAWP
jgi:AmmeMemoRadiSam system protein B